jgi:hypothetical protein
MGVLFQALFLMLLISVGTAGIYTNFLNDKTNYLRRLEELDRDQFRNKFIKLVGDPDTCRRAFRSISLTATSGTGLALQLVDPDVSVTFPPPVLGSGISIGSMQLISFQLSYADNTDPLTSGAFTKRGTISYRLRTNLGNAQRELSGQFENILFTPASPGTGISSCSFSLSGTGGGGGGGTSFDCNMFNSLGSLGVIPTPPGTTPCNLDPLVSGIASGSISPAADPLAEDALAKVSRGYADALKQEGCSEYAGIRGVLNPSGVGCGSSPPPPSACAPSGSTPACSQNAGFFTPLPSPPPCPPGTQSFFTFRNNQLIKIGCDNDGSTYPSQLQNSTLGSCSSTNYISIDGCATGGG